jgi:outer membrane protein assembly factor BamD (BamD/ComL family)
VRKDRLPAVILVNRDDLGHGLRLIIAAACLSLFPGCVRDADRRSAATSLSEQAWREVAFLNYGKAAGLFEKLRNSQAAGSESWRRSSLALAVCLHQKQPDVESDKAKAARLYDELLAGAADADTTPLALLFAARLADKSDFPGDTPDPATAASLYARLMREFPGSAPAHEAAVHLAQQRIFSGDEREARRGIEELQAWAEAHPGNPAEGLQWLEIGGAWRHPFNDPARAVEAFVRAEQAGLPPMTRRDAFFWRVANLAGKSGNTAVSTRYFERIIVEQPRSAYGYLAQRRIAALGGTPPPLEDPFADGEEPSENEGVQP